MVVRFAALLSVASAASFTLASVALPNPPTVVPATNMSPAAKDYLDRAIGLLRDQHINSTKMNWQALTARAYSAAHGAKTTADTYPAITLVIGALGEKHTRLIVPSQAKAEATGKAFGDAKPAPLLLPEGARLAGGVGVIRLYGFMGPTEQGKLYSETAQDKIAVMKASGVCRFVLDLRDNNGGNMYPMLNGVSGLLEPGILGSFLSPKGEYAPWALIDGAVTVQAPQTTLPVAASNQAVLPVAVLIGPQTASSGEFTAMSFRGRANTRFFGSPSAGFVTANTPMPLSDGAVLVMTNAYGLDRTGKKYVDKIEPDEETGWGGSAFDAALAWLSQQGCGGAKRARSSANHY